jgi:hypothetical protein
VRTPWSGRLFFGRTYEDAELDAALLPDGRVLCVAGAGETPFRLARDGRDVVAVDVNPEQIAYVRTRIAGAPVRDGVAERVLAAGRRLIGWRRRDLERFLALDDPQTQVGIWAALESRRFRAVLALTLRPRVLRPLHGDLAAAVPSAGEIRARLRRGFAMHANASNPYAHLWLLGEHDSEPPRPVETATARGRRVPRVRAAPKLRRVRALKHPRRSRRGGRGASPRGRRARRTAGRGRGAAQLRNTGRGRRGRARSA